DRLALRRAISKTDDRESADRLIRVRGHHRVQHRPDRVDDTRAVLRQELYGEERRTAGCRALVLETTSEELELLAEAELSDRPIRNCTLPIVAAAGRRFELVLPFLAQGGQLTLGACLRELVRLGGCLDEGHRRGRIARGQRWV